MGPNWNLNNFSNWERKNISLTLERFPKYEARPFVSNLTMLFDKISDTVLKKKKHKNDLHNSKRYVLVFMAHWLQRYAKLTFKNGSCLFLISVKYKHFRFAKIAVPQKRNVAWWAYFTNLVFRAVLHKIARRNFAGKLSCRQWLFTVSNISAKRTPVGNGTNFLYVQLFSTNRRRIQASDYLILKSLASSH